MSRDPEPQSPPRAGVLTADSITRSFGTTLALDGVTVSIAAGQCVSIMGPSGSGKSTLLHCLAGILRPDAGTVALHGSVFSNSSDATRSRLRREHFGFVFQDHQLLPELTAVATARSWLARLGLETLHNRRPGDMSGGQAQRVAIARAMAHRPAVIFADEPTGALDHATGVDVMHTLRSATRETGAAMVVVTHDSAVASWCDRHLLLADGRLVQDSADRLVTR